MSAVAENKSEASKPIYAGCKSARNGAYGMPQAILIPKSDELANKEAASKVTAAVIILILVGLTMVAVGTVYGIGPDKVVHWMTHSAFPWIQAHATALEIAGAAVGSFILGAVIARVAPKVFRKISEKEKKKEVATESNESEPRGDMTEVGSPLPRNIANLYRGDHSEESSSIDDYTDSE